MSGNCKHTVPCGCDDTPFVTPPACNTGTPECPTPDPCPETFCTECTVYCGDTIVDLGIKEGDRMDVILQMLSLYLTNPGCITPISTGAITSISITNPGLGYTASLNMTNVNLLGGTGSGAIGTVQTDASGLVTVVTVTTVGINYTEGDVLVPDPAQVGTPTIIAEIPVSIAACKSVLGVQSTTVTSSVINLAWLPDPSAVSGYVVEYKLATATSWIMNPAVAQSTNPVDVIGGLMANMNYHIRVKTACSSGTCYSVTILVKTKS